MVGNYRCRYRKEEELLNRKRNLSILKIGVPLRVGLNFQLFLGFQPGFPSEYSILLKKGITGLLLGGGIGKEGT